MTKTGTQNRPYTAEELTVEATFLLPGEAPHVMRFNWNNREQVRIFAGRSDVVIRAGGSTSIKSWPPHPRQPEIAKI